MRLLIFPLALLTMVAVQDGPENKIEDLVEDTRTKLCATLAKLEANPKDRRAAEQALGQEIVQAISKNIARLCPDNRTDVPEAEKTMSVTDGADSKMKGVAFLAVSKSAGGYWTARDATRNDGTGLSHATRAASGRCLEPSRRQCVSPSYNPRMTTALPLR